jgi:hypothetical protein
MRAVLRNSMLSIAAVASFSTARLDAGELPSRRGLYAIWGTSDLLNLPYITGGQVVVQWADLEPAEGTYDFAPLKAAMHALGDRPATLQVNGNRKPAWLFFRFAFDRCRRMISVWSRRESSQTLCSWLTNAGCFWTEVA